MMETPFISRKFRRFYYNVVENISRESLYRQGIQLSISNIHAMTAPVGYHLPYVAVAMMRLNISSKYHGNTDITVI